MGERRGIRVRKKRLWEQLSAPSRVHSESARLK
jgi:hypothetical protein